MAQNRHTDLWNRTEDSEISPHSYSQLTFDKGAKNIHWKRQFLQQMMLAKLHTDI
jgi:hypothetical protein